ncbi:hypothetical protein AB0L80_38660 [Streptomyces sp. NPDC052069]|uniref:hypothetical protein n=1 Tax=Streptomyces sp. NPDC052069 TaxID=3154650 RepID=UPI00342B8842
MDDTNTAEQSPIPIEAALGRMVYTAATVEMLVELTGTLLADGDAQVTELKGKPINALKKKTLGYAHAAGYLNVSMLKALEALLGDVSASMDNRNAYVHGAWAEQDGGLIAMNSKPGQFRIKPLTAEHLDQLTAELVQVRDRVAVWWNRAFAMKHPDAVVEGLEPDSAPPYLA